jgi:hypothetical protein
MEIGGAPQLWESFGGQYQSYTVTMQQQKVTTWSDARNAQKLL